jgi:3'-5' exoribonuclease
MLNQKELILLKKDDKIDHFLIVRKCEIRRSKANKPYYFLTLGDRTYSLSANIWDDFESYSSCVKAGDILKVEGIVDEYLGSPQIKIRDIRFINHSDNVSHDDFMSRSSRDPEEMMKEFFSRIKKVSNKKLKTLLIRIFDEPGFKKFAAAPAGKLWHHSYLHGLLEHTLEIIKICDLLCDFHREINRDLVIAGAMLHDFGKVEELSFDLTYEYTDKGKLLGHIVIAAMKINEVAAGIPDFPEDLKNCLLHIVLSHQGKLEFASPVVPKTLEAITLYHADELSAKVNAYKNALQAESKSDSKWTKWLSIVSTDLYNHGLTQDAVKTEMVAEKEILSGIISSQTTLFEKGKEL